MRNHPNMRDEEAAELWGERYQRRPCYKGLPFQFHDLFITLQISNTPAVVEVRNTNLETEERLAGPLGGDYCIAATHCFPGVRWGRKGRTQQ
jgi:hypothetical protein